MHVAPCGGVCDTEHRTDSPVPLLELTVWQRQQRASNDVKDAIAASWAVERGEMLCTAHGQGAGICGSGERCVLVLQPRGAEHSPRGAGVLAGSWSCSGRCVELCVRVVWLGRVWEEEMAAWDLS